jgi:hypothetical protein
MHRGHDHGEFEGGTAGAGHNHAQPRLSAAQWQTPHLHRVGDSETQSEPDLDLVEMAFVEGFAVASDPVSFLRLAGIPFEASDCEGRRFVLLRVEVDMTTDVGALMPHLGGASMRYDPLPASMITRRRKLAFIYFDGSAPRAFRLAQTRELQPRRD